MLFGHIEDVKQRIEHILRIRKLQDETSGFNCFILLVYQIKNNYFNIKKAITTNKILRTFAIT